MPHRFEMAIYKTIFPKLYCSCCSSVTRLCLTLCSPITAASGFPVLHYLSELPQTHVHWVSDAIQPSYLLSPPSAPALNLSQLQSFFQWVGSSSQVNQSIGASASASVLPVYIQDWFPLGWTGLISLPFKGLSRVFSSTTSTKPLFCCHSVIPLDSEMGICVKIFIGEYCH